MKRFLLTIIALLSAKSAFAGDAAWTVCTSRTFVISAFEHRATGDTRKTEITLIYGGHVVQGALLENSDKIELKSAALNFDGEIITNYKTNKMNMTGAMVISGETFDIGELLKCVDKTQTGLPGTSGH